jgi:hypothetical protein
MKKCPVPNNQRPLNEYITLKTSIEFNWTIDNFKNFIKKLVKLSFTCYLSFGLVFSVAFPTKTTLYEIFIHSSLFTLISIICITSRVYLSWKYVYNRLMQATIPYEESGWYDGQVWIKSSKMLTQDIIIGTYEVLPIINRLKRVLIVFFSLLILNLYLEKFIIK